MCITACLTVRLLETKEEVNRAKKTYHNLNKIIGWARMSGFFVRTKPRKQRDKGIIEVRVRSST
jgi:hypothetical protein